MRSICLRGRQRDRLFRLNHGVREQVSSGTAVRLQPEKMQAGVEFGDRLGGRAGDDPVAAMDEVAVEAGAGQVEGCALACVGLLAFLVLCADRTNAEGPAGSPRMRT